MDLQRKIIHIKKKISKISTRNLYNKEKAHLFTRALNTFTEFSF